MNNPIQPRALITELCKEAGQIIRDYFYTNDFSTEIKDDGSPVTEVDKKINSLVIKRILQNFPSHAIIGEEESYGSLDSEFVWICDPIDGTRPFTAGIPISTFSLSLLQSNDTDKGAPILASAYDPFLDKLIIAEKDRGAQLYIKDEKRELNIKNIKEKKLTVWVDGPLKSTTIDISLLLNELIKNDINFFTGRSYIYGSMLVALGKLDAAIMIGRTPWDIAAPDLIVTESGGICTSLYGKSQGYLGDVEGGIAANSSAHKILLEITNSIKNRA